MATLSKRIPRSWSRPNRLRRSVPDWRFCHAASPRRGTPGRRSGPAPLLARHPWLARATGLLAPALRATLEGPSCLTGPPPRRPHAAPPLASLQVARNAATGPLPASCAGEIQNIKPSPAARLKGGPSHLLATSGISHAATREARSELRHTAAPAERCAPSARSRLPQRRAGGRRVRSHRAARTDERSPEGGS